MKPVIFFVIFLILKLTNSEITLKNVQVLFENHGNKTNFVTKIKFGNQIKSSNAWLGIGFNSGPQMVK